MKRAARVSLSLNSWKIWGMNFMRYMYVWVRVVLRGTENEFIAWTGKGCHWLSISMMLSYNELLYLFPISLQLDWMERGKKIEYIDAHHSYIMNALNEEWSNFYVILLCCIVRLPKKTNCQTRNQYSFSLFCFIHKLKCFE